QFPPDDDCGIWEGWSMLAALAATTSRMEIGPLVACTTFRNPALLAKMAVTVDEISGGRLVLGLGAGWHEPDFRAFGFPFDHRVSRFEEALIIITTLLRDGAIDFDGQYYQVRDCELLPHGPRPQGPPIVVGGLGERMLHLAVRYADAWDRPLAPAAAIADLPNWQARVDVACATEGRGPTTVARWASIGVDVSGTASAEASVAHTGSPEVLAEALQQYADAGISHVQVWLEPTTTAGIETFGRTLELLDRTA
ncbi:MAG TPA: LLM class flavin-dependent oxidoreductase, partial [Thermomicrobiales bacterium]|nr:LLM class flavin-dependent oxidoreductase [Thermomicrobiales bacterium]